MKRSSGPELIDNPEVPEETMKTVHREIVRVNRYLGNIGALESLIENDAHPVRTVLDIGCGHGGLLLELKRRLPIEAWGVDVRVPEVPIPGIQIAQGDAVRDPLPGCDVAIATYLIHHLCDADVIKLINNIGRSCRRFIFIEPVRSRVPLALFKLFAGSFLGRINARDGAQSIRRSHTKEEMSVLVARALAGSGSTFRHSVAPFCTRQIIDILYEPA
jgi:SAM-dependent methyltransferase